ncbi:site-specific recombinase XerC [Paraburkholderia sp. GAS206C]
MSTRIISTRDNASRALTAAEFLKLSNVPPEIEWSANIDAPQTRRAYRIDLRDFMGFVGIVQPEEFRTVTRAHVLAWRKHLEARQLSGATIRRKLAALSSLFDYLCERNAVLLNPVASVKRPKGNSNEGKTPAMGDHQARALLHAPDADTLKGKRDRAMLAVLLYHGLRREELCLLKVRDIHQRRGVLHLRVHGKGSKIRHLPLHPASAERLHAFLRWRDMERRRTHRCFSRCVEGAPEAARRSPEMGSTSACGTTRGVRGSLLTVSAYTACAPRRRQTHWSTRPRSPKSSFG